MSVKHVLFKTFFFFSSSLPAFHLNPHNDWHRSFFSSFLTLLQTPCLITMKTPSILQQFTWAVPRPVLDSVRAKAMATTKKVSRWNKGAATRSSGASCDSSALKNKQTKPNNIQLSHLYVPVYKERTFFGKKKHSRVPKKRSHEAVSKIF